MASQLKNNTAAINNLIAAIQNLPSSAGGGVQIDATLTQSGAAADAKVVGDILETKANILTDDDAFELAAELGLINPITDENGAIYTDKNGEILSL